jgi:glutathione synthase/RimK-type ligase-like ATP-grasp enzyme
MIKAMYSYTNVSEGSAELKDALGIPRIKHTNSKFKAKRTDIILNWGATTDRFPEALRGAGRIINRPEDVDKAVDKLVTFNHFIGADVPCPEFTTEKAVATSWLEEGKMVFARTMLRAHSGRGIVIMDPEHPDTWETNAPLYVKYIPKKFEYRIHVCRGEVIDTQRKGLREELRGDENVNFKVRNLANGFVYVRNDGHVVPECVLDCGIRAVGSLGLDFGAADVIYNQRNDSAYALEVNTAPGLQGTTVENYRAALARM